MTLFFVQNEVAIGIGKRIEEDPHKLVSLADVVVIVGKDDKWVTTIDRHHTHGQIVPPERRAALLERYTTIVKPTNYLHE
jgi:hypothetical protein